MQTAKWLRWSLLQAFCHSLNRIPQKKAALIVGRNLPGVYVMTLVVGIVQAVVGLVTARMLRNKILDSKWNVWGSILCGVFAFASLTLGNAAFSMNADIGIVTFIVTLSIIPGAFIDAFFFGHSLNRRGWLGIAVFLFAGYAILGWPSFEQIKNLPMWVLLALGIPLSNSIFEGISQKIRDVSPWTKNFWGGLSTIACCATGLAITGLPQIALSRDFWLWSVALGVCVVGIWLFNLLSYHDKATIAAKKLVVWAVYLTLAMVIGIVFFKEPLTVGKVVAVVLYPLAYVLVSRGTLEALQEKASQGKRKEFLQAKREVAGNE